MLHQWADTLWTWDEPMPKFGVDAGARMTIARLKNGDLWVHAPFAVAEIDAEKIEKLGRVAHIVAPNTFHFLEIEPFARRFPDATLWVCAGLEKRLQDVPHRVLTGVPDEWNGDFDGHFFECSRFWREWIFCHRASQSLIVTDFVLNVPRPRNPRGRIAARIADVGRGIGPSRLERTLIKLGHRKTARETLRAVLSWQWERLVMAHGKVVESNGKSQLKRAFRWL